jgi:hypothetical protein
MYVCNVRTCVVGDVLQEGRFDILMNYDGFTDTPFLF